MCLCLLLQPTRNHAPASTSQGSFAVNCYKLGFQLARGRDDSNAPRDDQVAAVPAAWLLLFTFFYRGLLLYGSSFRNWSLSRLTYEILRQSSRRQAVSHWKRCRSILLFRPHVAGAYSITSRDEIFNDAGNEPDIEERAPLRAASADRSAAIEPPRLSQEEPRKSGGLLDRVFGNDSSDRGRPGSSGSGGERNYRSLDQ